MNGSAANNTMQTYGDARHFPNTMSSEQNGTIIEQLQSIPDADFYNDRRQTSAFVNPDNTRSDEEKQVLNEET